MTRRTSSREIMIWIRAGASIAVFGSYFVRALFVLRGSGEHDGSLIALLIGAVVSLIIVEVAGHILLSIVRRGEPTVLSAEERRSVKALQATRNAHYTVMIGTWLAAAAIFLGTPTFVLAHALSFLFVASGTTYIVTRLFSVRRSGFTPEPA